jgi:hypothetical protein
VHLARLLPTCQKYDGHPPLARILQMGKTIIHIYYPVAGE